MPNLCLEVAYEGTHYLGWQKTKMGPSIEGVLETVLQQVLQEEVTLQAASRTDAGVHAEGQIVNFKTTHLPPYDSLLRALQGLLPKDIAVKKVSLVPEAFHPTLDNKGKEYHYRLYLGPIHPPFERHISWHWPYPLDLSLIQQAIPPFLGTHDFAAFCNQRHGLPTETVRTLYAIDCLHTPPLLTFSLKGENFLYKMARNIVGTLVYIGCGKLDPHSIPFTLKAKDRTLAGITAPAHGLCLKNIFY